MSDRTHIIVIIVTLATVAFLWRLVNTRQLRSKYGLLWLLTAVLMITVAAVPTLLDSLSEAMGVEYGPTTFTFLAIGYLFVIVVLYSWELSRGEERLRSLAEEIALLSARIERLERTSQDEITGSHAEHRDE